MHQWWSIKGINRGNIFNSLSTHRAKHEKHVALQSANGQLVLTLCSSNVLKLPQKAGSTSLIQKKYTIQGQPLFDREGTFRGKFNTICRVSQLGLLFYCIFLIFWWSFVLWHSKKVQYKSLFTVILPYINKICFTMIAAHVIKSTLPKPIDGHKSDCCWFFAIKSVYFF